MPELLIDITRLLYRRMKGQLPTGMDRVSLEYVRHFGSGARAMLGWRGLSAALSPADSAFLFAELLEPGPRVAEVARKAIVKACVSGWLLPRLAGHLLFNTAHYGLDNRAYGALLRFLGARPIVVVHDLIPITHPQYCRSGERERHISRMRNSLAMARGIVVNSRYTLDTLRAFAREERLAMPPAVVAPLASALCTSSPGPRPLAEPYFVSVGTIEPRKNQRLLLRVWRELVERVGAAAPKLVIIGQRGWDVADVIDTLENPRSLSGFVIEKNLCSDAELATWLRHAQALLMPSWVEGYGLPVAEALAAGVPVIASELAAFREVAGDVPEYADPKHEEQWVELIADYVTPQSARRQAQLARIPSFRATSWQEHFRIVDAFLESLA